MILDVLPVACNGGIGALRRIMPFDLPATIFVPFRVKRTIFNTSFLLLLLKFTFAYDFRMSGSVCLGARWGRFSYEWIRLPGVEVG